MNQKSVNFKKEIPQACGLKPANVYDFEKIQLVSFSTFDQKM